MKPRYLFTLKPVFYLIDLIIIYYSFIIAWNLRMKNFDPFKLLIINDNIRQLIADFVIILYLSISIWMILSYILNLQHVPRRKHPSQFWKYFAYPQFILIFFLLLNIVFINVDDISSIFLICFLILQFSLLWISRKIRKKITLKLRGLGYNYVGLSVIGDEFEIQKTKDWIKKNYESGFFNYSDFKLSPLNFDTKVDFALAVIEVTNTGDYILIQPSYLEEKDLIEIIDLAENKGAHVFHIVNNQTIENFNIKKVLLGPYFVQKTRFEPLKSGINIINKRIIDFVISILTITLIYWWLYLIIGVIIKLSSKGPVIFKQERVGKNGQIFSCYKFRTMHIDSSNSKLITKKRDSRIFSFGNFLRKSNLDELPQFINVLKGDMSVVGPRPHMLSEDNELANIIKKYRLRYWVRPGITGLAAISGFRGGTESMDKMQTRINLDIQYIENWNIRLDISIIFKTAMEMLSGKSKGY